jgi:hypothetical protein
MKRATAAKAAAAGQICKAPKIKAMIAGMMTKGKPSFTIIKMPVADTGGQQIPASNIRLLSLSYVK